MAVSFELSDYAGFRKAAIADAEPLAALINSAYRGESSRQGWTTEADLLEGLRTDAGDLIELMASSNALLLVCEAERQLLGSVNVQKSGESARIGMLAVAPKLQARGLGKRLLQYAERVAQSVWRVNRFEMAVIAQRRELIAFYQRRGYSLTKQVEPFPENPALWQPKVQGLQLSILEKLV